MNLYKNLCLYKELFYEIYERKYIIKIFFFYIYIFFYIQNIK